MPRGASPKREREYKEIEAKFEKEGRYKGREEEVAARIVNKQRKEAGETQDAALAKKSAAKKPAAKSPLPQKPPHRPASGPPKPARPQAPIPACQSGITKNSRCRKCAAPWPTSRPPSAARYANKKPRTRTARACCRRWTAFTDSAHRLQQAQCCGEQEQGTQDARGQRCRSRIAPEPVRGLCCGQRQRAIHGGLGRRRDGAQHAGLQP